MTSELQCDRKLNVILTGATGMVGEGVLHQCLLAPEVERVLIINRRASGVRHDKLKEIVHPDLGDLESLQDQLAGYDACFYCLGTSSLGMSESKYARVTYDLTLHMATLLCKLNPDMVFCYVTAIGTDSSEHGKTMWARVKGRTENALQRLPFRGVYLFRPAYIHPTPGLKRAHGFYKYIAWSYPLLRRWFPRHSATLEEIGRAMIHAAMYGYPKPVLDCPDMVELAAARPNMSSGDSR